MISQLLFILLSASTIYLLISCGVNTHALDPANPGGGTSGPPPAEHLAVADLGNNRVLIFDAPFTSNENASVVIGQPDFTEFNQNQAASFGEGSPPASANTLYWPDSVAVDRSGDLWLADLGNCRVLEFIPPLVTDMKASRVIGHPDFSYSGSQSLCVGKVPGSAGMESPVSIAFDPRGNLWVADYNASRVTEYKPPFVDGMAAVIAIGQPGLDEGYQCNGADDSIGRGNDDYPPPPTASTLCGPGGIAFDSLGDLWVADGGNSRVLMYKPPLSTGMAASLELGQPASSAFTSYHCGNTSPGTMCQFCAPSAATLCIPESITFDSHGNLWVADTRNSRILEFAPPFSNGMSASLVIGEPDFTAGNPKEDYFPPFTPSAKTLYGPSSLSFEGRGNLVVADRYDCRVLVYIPPFHSGMAANLVIGKTTMDEGCPAGTASANTLQFPAGVGLLTF